MERGERKSTKNWQLMTGYTEKRSSWRAQLFHNGHDTVQWPIKCWHNTTWCESTTTRCTRLCLWNRKCTPNATTVRKQLVNHTSCTGLAYNISSATILHESFLISGFLELPVFLHPEIISRTTRERRIESGGHAQVTTQTNFSKAPVHSTSSGIGREKKPRASYLRIFLDTSKNILAL